MRVAVIKLGSRISVSSNDSSGGTGETLSVIKILTTAGIEVDAYTKVLSKDLSSNWFKIYNILDEIDNINSINFDNNKDIQVPCCVEKNPYVNFLTVGTKIVEVQFSKYGEIEKDTVGYHDCSLFYGNIYHIYEKCKEYHDTYFSEAGQNYISYNHGKDFNFLDIFNRFSANGYICELNGKAVKSFNTIDELSRVGGSI